MNSFRTFPARCTAMVLLISFISTGFVPDAAALDVRRPLTEDQRIIHVLDRLGFGARPGDVERVRSIGIKKYIEQQLDPGSIADTAAEQKVKGIEAYQLTTAELFAKYPNPGALLRQLEGGRRGQNPAAAPADPAADNAARRERQQKLRKLYREYDLRPAGQLVPQIAANRVLRAVYSERQLQEVMVDFWQNHFNVFAGKAAVRWYIPSYERDVLRKNALGNFRDLLVGTAQHPAMLFFLDNFESVAPNSESRAGNGGRMQALLRGGTLSPQMRARIKERRGWTDAELDRRLNAARQMPANAQRRGLNENYARELMELHTLGVDGGYTQNDIVEVAKAFTGWTIADPRGYRRAAASAIQGTDDSRLDRLQRRMGIPGNVESGEFYFNSRWHQSGVKTVLGQKIDEGGVKDGLKVLDILVKHPSTARFLAKKLAVKFVSDKPSDALVDRVAAAFLRSGGDIGATLSALFSDAEFFAPENYRAKIKTPFELAISSVRALGADTNGGPAFLAMLNKLGEVPYGYQAPTGYPDTAEDWVNTGALLERLNFAVAIASNRIPGTTVDLKRFGNKLETLDRALSLLLHGEVSPNTRELLARKVKDPLPAVTAGDELDDAEVPEMRPQGAPGARGRTARLLPPSGDPEVFKAVSLVLGTPEFQRQ